MTLMIEGIFLIFILILIYILGCRKIYEFLYQRS